MSDTKQPQWTEQQIASRRRRFAHSACPGTPEDEVDVCATPDDCARNGCELLAQKRAARSYR